MISILIWAQANCFLSLSFVNGHEIVEFNSRNRSPKQYIVSPDDHVVDFALLNDKGLSTITLSGGLTLEWNPSTGKVRNVCNKFPLIIVGARKGTIPVVFRRLGPKKWQKQFWTGHLNEFKFFGEVAPLSRLLRQGWGFTSRNMRSSVFDDNVAMRIYSPSIREEWLSDNFGAKYLTWQSGRVMWQGKLCYKFENSADLMTMSGNNQIGTVSVVFDENPRMRTSFGRRDYWVDHGTNGTTSERYVSIMIDMRTGHIVKTVPGAARIELLRQAFK